MEINYNSTNVKSSSLTDINQAQKNKEKDLESIVEIAKKTAHSDEIVKSKKQIQASNNPIILEEKKQVQMIQEVKIHADIDSCRGKITLCSETTPTESKNILSIEDHEAENFFLMKAIKLSKKERAEIEGLLATQISTFEEKLQPLADSFINYAELLDLDQKYLVSSTSSEGSKEQTDSSSLSEHKESHSSSDDIDENYRNLTIQIEEKKKSLQIEINQLATLCPDFHLSKHNFDILWFLNTTSQAERHLHSLFFQEQLINRCIDHVCFFNHVTNDIIKMKSLIIEHFCTKSLSNQEKEEVTFQLVHSTEPTEETHKLGKIATKIQFNLKNDCIFNIYYKPRSAIIDEKAMDLFIDFNTVKDKSIKADIGTCKIINIVSEEESRSFSLWGDVEGKKFKEAPYIAITETIHYGNQDKNKKSILLEQLRRLGSICKHISLSDLHGDNVIIQQINR